LQKRTSKHEDLQKSVRFVLPEEVHSHSLCV
jgi:hypothetical protein